MSSPLPDPGILALGIGPGAEVRDTLTLLRTAEESIRRQFLLSIEQAGLLNTIEEIVELLERGQVAEALAGLEGIAPQLSNAINTSYSAAGLNAANEIRRQLAMPDFRLNFNLLNIRSVARLQETRLDLVRAFQAEGREVTTELLSIGLNRGDATIDIARNLRDSLGLTPAQIRIVENYRRDLESGSRNALRRKLRDRRFDPTVEALVEGRRGPLSQERIDRMVERYRERWLAFRAQTLAETEALAAVSQGEEETWLQAVEDGVIEGFSGTWRTARDERVRDSHDDMEGQVRGMGEPFVSGNQNLLRFPGDPSAPAEEIVRCRCTIERRIVAA